MRGKVCGQGPCVRPRVGGMWWGSGVSLSNVGAVQMLLSCLFFPHLNQPATCSHAPAEGWQGRTVNPGTGRSVALEYCWTGGWKDVGKGCVSWIDVTGPLEE